MSVRAIEGSYLNHNDLYDTADELLTKVGDSVLKCVIAPNLEPSIAEKLEETKKG